SPLGYAAPEQGLPEQGLGEAEPRWFADDGDESLGTEFLTREDDGPTQEELTAATAVTAAAAARAATAEVSEPTEAGPTRAGERIAVAAGAELPSLRGAVALPAQGPI